MPLRGVLHFDILYNVVYYYWNNKRYTFIMSLLQPAGGLIRRLYVHEKAFHNFVAIFGTIRHVFPFPRKSQKNNQPIIQIATNSRGLHLKTNFNSNFPLGNFYLFITSRMSKVLLPHMPTITPLFEQGLFASKKNFSFLKNNPQY